MNHNAIEIENLSYSYEGTRVLRDVSLRVSPKGFLTLMGPNGGGKTTLLKLMVGLLQPESGSVTIFGGSPQKMYSYIGYVPQNTHFNTKFPISVLEVVMLGHECGKRPFFGYGKHEVACAEGALEQVGMFAHKDDLIGSLSGGQRQRVLIARALCAHNTKILFLDEPTSSLDSTGQRQIYELLKTLSESLAVVVVSHDLSMMLDYATQICYVNETVKQHDAPTYNKSSLMHTLGLKGEHFCEVELLNCLGQKDA